MRSSTRSKPSSRRRACRELAPAADGIEDEDLIEREDMVVTVTMGGYIKRTPLAAVPRAEARRQGPRRNGDQGRGRGHQPVRHLDAQSGAVLLQPRPRLPDEGVEAARRRPEHQGPANGQPAPAGRRAKTISTVLPLPEDETEWGGLHIMFATAHGTVRRNSMAAFTNIPTAGKIAMRFGTGPAEEAETDDDDDEQVDPTRPADRRFAADRGRRRPARDAPRQGDPLHGHRRSRVPVARRRPAFAASASLQATR